VIKHVVQTEVVPRIRRQERTDLHRIVGAGTQSHEAIYDEIAERRMVIVLTAFLATFCLGPVTVVPCLKTRPCQPFACEGVQILVNPRHNGSVIAFQMMAQGIGPQSLK